MTLVINKDSIIFDHSDIVFNNSYIYIKKNNTILKEDLSDADYMVDKNRIKKINPLITPYIIQTNDNKLSFGYEKNIEVNKLYNVRRITRLNLVCKIYNYIYLLKDNYKYAERGVKYGATTLSVLNYIKRNNLNIQIDLFEKNKNCCDLLKDTFKDEKNINIFCGDASKTLNESKDKYDFVFFDASHHYKIDNLILQSLIPHLKPSSIIIFDDYNSREDVKRLVDEFERNYNFKNVYKL